MSNFFNLESIWLSGISNTANKSVPVSDLTDNIKPLGNALSDASFNLALQNQLIINEQHRLNDKQQSIDLAKTSQNRMITLNNSYSARSNAITKIILTVVLTVSVFIALMFIHRSFPDIPGGLVDLAYVVVLSFGVIRCLMIYMDIQTRDPLYFDQIGLPPPVLPDTSGANKPVDPNGSLLGNIGTCIGQACCDPTSTTWNPETSTCQLGTTTLAPIKQPFSTMANSDSEYESYAPY